MTPAPLTDLASIRTFILGGHATFTLVSKVTGQRKTFRVEASDERPGCFFVSLLVGPDNGSDYRYLAFLVNHEGVPDILTVHTNKERWGAEAYNSVAWLVNYLNRWNRGSVGKLTPAELRALCEKFDAQAEFWHEGHCCRCGRVLTTPESVAKGIGPVCEEKGVM